MKGAHDWTTAKNAARDGRLLEYLNTLPPERWNVSSFSGTTYLHFAVLFQNYDAVRALLKYGANPNALGLSIHVTPLHLAVSHLSHGAEMVRLLLAGGANMRVEDRFGSNPVDCAFYESYDDACAKVFISNGKRFSVVDRLQHFARGVLSCRSVAVAFLNLKRRGALRHVDRFLMREISLAVWTTREEEAHWSPP